MPGASGQTDEPGQSIQAEPAESAVTNDNDAQFSAAVPTTLTLPVGTLIRVRLEQLLSSDKVQPGDSFSANMDQPLATQGWVVALRGQTAIGRVAAAQPAGRVKGVSQLAVELTELVLVDGQQVLIQTQLVQSSAGTSTGQDAQAIGTTTGIGAFIGAAAGGGEGAAIGAAAGAAAGIAGILSTRGRPTELYPETLLIFRLEAPVTISTEQSRQAYHSVTQTDYSSTTATRNPPRKSRIVKTYPSAPYYIYAPFYSYPGWNVGYGIRSRYYGHPRYFFGGGGSRR